MSRRLGVWVCGVVFKDAGASTVECSGEYSGFPSSMHRGG